MVSIKDRDYLSRMVLLNESTTWSLPMISMIRDSDVLRSGILEGDESALGKVFQNNKRRIANFNAFLERTGSWELEELIENVVRGGISPILIFDEDYPPNLRMIRDPPLIIYHAGSLYDLSNCIAISGVRDPSSNLEKLTLELSERLSSSGHTIISGLAEGVDTFAHRGALNIPDGTSVAVIPSGLDHIVPSKNVELAGEIASRGAVISERVIRTRPSKYDFIKRNRIISGISRCHIIIQSHGSGGTEHQFRLAREQGKRIFVLDSDELDDRSIKSAKGMISRGASGFSNIDDAIEQISSYIEGGNDAIGKDVSLDNWT